MAVWWVGSGDFDADHRPEGGLRHFRHRIGPLRSRPMTQTNPSKRPLEPKLQIRMQGEESMTLRGAVEILTPRWAKRLVRRCRSS